MPVLPIRVPGRTDPIEVPCRLPDCFDFRAFLPSRGVRIFTCWLTTADPRTAEVKDVQLAHRETDPRLKNGFELDHDEQRRADEAAGDVLDGLLTALGSRAPTFHVLQAIALAWSTEGDAVTLQTFMCLALRKADMSDADRDAYGMVPNLDSTAGQARSPACEGMRGYVQHALEQAALAQADKAERQQAEHSHARSDDEDGSERIRAPRSLDVPTLKCLDVEY